MASTCRTSVLLLLCLPLAGCYDLRRSLLPPPKATTLREAIYRKDYAQFKKLVPTHAGELNALEGGYGMLHSAATLGDADGVRVLVEAGADVNLQEAQDAVTPLHRAQTGAVVRELIKGKVDLEARTTLGGETPLLIAAGTGSCDLVAALLDAGANPNVQDDFQRTPLMRVFEGTSNGRTPAEKACIIRALARAGADLNLYTKLTGNTPLYAAARHGHDAEITLLVSLGADPNFHDRLNLMGALGVVLEPSKTRTNEQRLNTCRTLVQAGVNQDIIQEAIYESRPDREAENVKIVEFLRTQLAAAKPPAADSK